MFSGLIQKKGIIIENQPPWLAIRAPLKKVKKGDSIAINGVCLTVAQLQKKGRGKINLKFHLSPETYQKTVLKTLNKGIQVNLETPLGINDVLGGHIVQGHVDGIGKIKRIINQGQNKTFWIEAPRQVLKYLVPKGSVALDGVSLTVVKVLRNQFSLVLIPFTLLHTNLGSLKVGDRVNLESDILGKYVLKYAKLK